MQPNIKLLVKGFQLFEQRIIETTIRLSANRSPSLSIVPDVQFQEADLIIIDALDVNAMQWASDHQSALKGQVVVWVDINTPLQSKKHATLNRPVLWVNLPITATRILEELSFAEIQTDTDSVDESTAEESAKALASVLVVDDSQAIRDYLSETLKKRGYSVRAAESGEAAIEEAKAQRFDCVLMDVLMPGIDGYKACREIRRIKSGGGPMSVVMLTSKTSPFDKIRGKMAGCDAYLTKPVKMAHLLQTVEKYAIA